MNDPVRLRQYTREVLCMARQRWFNERLLFDSVKNLCRDALTVDELKAALMWNEVQEYVESKEDKEARIHPDDPAVIIWHITETGLKREGFL